MLPGAFTDRMKKMLGGEYEAFLASYDQDKYQALRLNPLKAERERFLHQSHFSLTPVPWEENGFYYEKEDAPGRHPYHEAGVYYIQEPSAMAPVPFLEVKPGERVLDLCAAPGGKSTQIGAALRGEGMLICNEIHPARAKILSENIERLGIRNAIVLNESPEKLAEHFVEYFDKILVDAPCSGEGMFRKNEEACAEWSPENVQICADRQDFILDRAAEMLCPGGRMVYSTCTFAPEEDEGSISRFLERHPEFAVAVVQIPEGFDDVDHTMRIWPHKVKGEGHYVAVLEKAGELPERGSVRSLYGLQKGISEKEYGEYLDFRKEFLNIKLEGVFLKFGDQLYLGPEDMPSLNKLKVLRPGLHLGTLKKNRFEPSHALALALQPDDVKYSHDLRAADRTAAAFISGQTFPVESGKGWHLITVDGYSLGWGKAAGGIMKNHYPKGLRKF